MSKSYAVLPCNGLDKCAGCVSREIAIRLQARTGSEIICPVLYRVSDARYAKLAAERPLLVLDGCATRCASRLAAERNLKIAAKVNLSDEAKAAGIELPQGLTLDHAALDFVEYMVEKLISDDAKVSAASGEDFFPNELTYQTHQKDKFLFRVPEDKGLFFNENDVWAYVSGGRARVGVTDYVQKSLSDVVYFTPPAIGKDIDQFGEAGTIESGKAVFEVVSPVSGRITAVNDKLEDAPELINENPYVQGWLFEIELSDFESDRDLLHEFEGYFPILKRKADDYHAKN